MGVESFTEENRSPLHVGTYISVDMAVCKVTPVILHGVVSPEKAVTQTGRGGVTRWSHEVERSGEVSSWSGRGCFTIIGLM
jgi:hypothetical protein